MFSCIADSVGLFGVSCARLSACGLAVLSFSMNCLAVFSVIRLLLIVSRVSAVWALLQSVLLNDQLPARARVGICLIVFSCLLFGSRLPARWPGLRRPAFCFLLLDCVASLLIARARVVVHLVILYSPVRLAWLNTLFLLCCRSFPCCPSPYWLLSVSVCTLGSPLQRAAPIRRIHVMCCWMVLPFQ